MPADAPGWLDWPTAVPVPFWIVLAGTAAILIRYLQLLARARSMPTGPDTRAALADLHTALQQYARDHEGRLPDSLAALNLTDAARLVYRPVRTATADSKLLIAHDAAPLQTLIEFPHARAARHVLFLSGRIHLVTESAFDRLIEADDAFRARLGIE